MKLLAAVTASALLLAACGGDDDATGDDATADAEATVDDADDAITIGFGPLLGEALAAGEVDAIVWNDTAPHHRGPARLEHRDRPRVP